MHTGNTIIQERQAHSSATNRVTFSPDSLFLASCSDDHTIRLWDIARGAAVNQTFGVHESIVYGLAFSPDGNHLVSGSADRTIRVWDVRGRVIVGLPIETHMVHSLNLSSDGTKAVSGGYGDNTDIMVWDLLTSSAVGLPLRGHTAQVESVIFTPDDTRIVSCSWDRTIRIWDIQTRNTAPGEQPTREVPIGPVVLSPDHSRFVSSSSSRPLQIWDMQTGAPDSCPFDDQADLGSIRSIAYSSQGSHVAASSDDCTIRVWNALTRATVSQPLKGHIASVTCLTFSPDGAFICSGSDDSTIIVWAIESAAIVGRPYEGHTGSVRSVVYSHNGTHLASGAADGTIRIWDPSTGTLVRTLSGHEGSVESVAFSLDGRYVVSGSADKSVRKWEVDGECSVNSPMISSVTYHASAASDPVEYRCSDAVSSIAYSPDGNHVLAGFGSTIRILNAQITEVVSELPLPENEMVRWVGFSPDGDQVLSVSVSKEETKDSKSKQIGEATIQESPKLEPPNIIRVWRPTTHIGNESSSMTPGDWSHEPDGRILSPDGLVIWVSPDLIPYLEKYAVSDRNPYVWSSEGVIDMGYKDLCIGERWAECYIQKNRGS